MGAGLVSVIIPTFNRAHSVPRAIDSVLAQSYGDVQVIVIDDGSTDDTRAVVLDRYGKDERIRYVHQPNRGVSAARNHGIRLVEGAFAALLDSDDAWKPFKLELELAVLQAFPDAGMVWTDMTAIGPDGQVRADRYLKRYYGAYKCFTSDDLFDQSTPLAEIVPALARDVGGHLAYCGDIYSPMVVGNLVHTSTVLLRRERLAAAGLFDEACRSGEDHAFHLSTCRAGRVAFADVSSILYQVGNTDHLASRENAAEMARKFLATVTRALDRDRDRIRLPPHLLDETMADAHRWLGESLLHDGHRAEARQHIRESLRLRPRQPRLVGLYAAALLPTGVRDGLLGVYRKIKQRVA